MKRGKRERGEHREYLKMSKQVFSLVGRRTSMYPDSAEFILRFQVVRRPLTRLDPRCRRRLASFCPRLAFCVNSLCFFCFSGLRRLLHQPAVRLRRVPGGGPRGSEEGGRQTGARHTRESKGQGKKPRPCGVRLNGSLHRRLRLCPRLNRRGRREGRPLSLMPLDHLPSAYR